MVGSNVASIISQSRRASGHTDRSQDVLASYKSGEIFIAVVGPVGAGSSRAIESLRRACTEAGYETEWIKVSDQIKAWARDNGKALPDFGRRTIENVRFLQDMGDEMRTGDPAALARSTLAEIARRRAVRTGATFTRGQVVQPGDKKVAYLIDSIRHPAETHLFRRTYANAFALIGVVCEEKERFDRIKGKYLTRPEERNADLVSELLKFVERDADDEAAPNGQHVAKAFFEADYFIDNTMVDPEDKDQLLDEPLARLISIIAHDRLIRPTMEETAMHHAHSARVRSACLSRQVGAALVDSDGTVVATGVNEVPKAGGGVYGEQLAGSAHADHRCAFRENAFCSSNVEQNRIIDQLIELIPELRGKQDRVDLRKTIRKTSVGQLIEFSRAVHAEMDALLSAGREGTSTVGTRLFVTTFPCHYCARHIVSAGVYEVQFIEPYPKSLALSLHEDAITVDVKAWQPPEEVGIARERRIESGKEESVPQGKVLFRPFVGVAPRLYLRAFEKTRDLKDKESGDMRIGSPEWGDEWSPFTVAYPELEAALTRGT